jgi:lactoylglutathione lyase
MSTADAIEAPVAVPGRPTWQQTMLRIKDPRKSIAFYKQLGFTLVDSFDFPQYKFSLYFMTTLKPGTAYSLTPGTQAAHDYLWRMEGTALELTHNHGTETQEGRVYHVGNQERDGFGHVAVK